MNSINKSKITSFLPIFIIIETYKSWRDDRTLRLGAGVAYYGVFAVIPIFTLMVGVAAYFFSIDSIQSYVYGNLQNILGSQLTETLNNFIIDFKANDVAVTNTGIIGVVALFISASFIFIALQDALDVVWHNPVRRGWKKWILRYFIAYLVVLITSFLLVGALLVNTISSLAEAIIPGELQIVENFADVVFSLGAVSIGALVLALIFRLLIYMKVSWSVLIIGSFITTALIITGTVILGYYLTTYGASSLSGALGAVLLLLVWVYYEAQIILIGAQLIKILQQNKDRIGLTNLTSRGS